MPSLSLVISHILTRHIAGDSASFGKRLGDRGIAECVAEFLFAKLRVCTKKCAFTPEEQLKTIVAVFLYLIDALVALIEVAGIERKTVSHQEAFYECAGHTVVTAED